MAPRYAVPTVLLLAAAVGWAVCPPGPAPDTDPTDLAVRQFRDDGSVAPALLARHRGGGPAVALAPVACLALSAATAAAGIRAAYRRRPSGD